MRIPVFWRWKCSKQSHIYAKKNLFHFVLCVFTLLETDLLQKTQKQSHKIDRVSIIYVRIQLISRKNFSLNFSNFYSARNLHFNQRKSNAERTQLPSCCFEFRVATAWSMFAKISRTSALLWRAENERDEEKIISLLRERRKILRHTLDWFTYFWTFNSRRIRRLRSLRRLDGLCSIPSLSSLFTFSCLSFYDSESTLSFSSMICSLVRSILDMSSVKYFGFSILTTETVVWLEEF